MVSLLNCQHLEEVGLQREELARGALLHVVKDHVRLPDSNSATREFVVHPGAVMIIPMLDNGHVVLERQFRYPVGRVIVEFPAGKLDKGEPSLNCAIRELSEETGFTAREWAYAGRLHPLVAYSTEHIDVWFAKGLTPGDQQLDSGEFLDVFDASPDQLTEWCRSGAVTDAKTLVGALWLQNVCSGAWHLDWCAVGSPDLPCPPGPYCPVLTERL